MSIFSELAPKFNEKGISVVPIPLGGKRVFAQNWSKWSTEQQSLADIHRLDLEFPNSGIGVVTGEASRLVVLDYDGDSLPGLQELRSILPNCPVRLSGTPGRGAFFFRFTTASQSQSWAGLGEVLANGRMLVLPPSVHTSGTPYYWDGPPLLEWDAIPDWLDIYKDILQDIGFKYPKRKTPETKTTPGTNGGRHDELLRWLFCRVEKYGKDKKSLASELIEYDMSVHKNPWLSDKSEHAQGRRQVATKMVEGVIKTVINKKTLKGEEWHFGQNDYDEHKAMFEKHFSGAKKCFFTGDVFLNGKNIWNMAGVIKSRGHDIGLRPDKVMNHLERWCEELKPELLLNVPKWDGKDRLSQIAGMVKVKNATTGVLEDFLKGWLAGCWRRVYDKRFQNRMLILQGKQGIGKSFLIETLTDGWDRYCSEVDISEYNKTNVYLNITGKVVVKISEFDQSDRQSVAFLKNLVTLDEISFRGPWERKAESRKLHCSFISSCNVRDVFRDSTGNRRFAFFEIEEIARGYPNSYADKDQIVAQGRSLYESGYEISSESVEAMKKIIESMTPEDPDNVIMSDIVNTIKGLGLGLDNLTYDSIKATIEGVARVYRRSPISILSLLRRSGVTRHTNKGGLYSFSRYFDAMTSLF